MTNTAQSDETRDFGVTRVFDAPVELAWQAWTDPQHVMRWWGPQGFTSPIAKLDVREGGTSLVCMRSPEGQDFYNTWTYQKIVPMERLEFILSFADADGKPVEPVTIGLPADMHSEVPHVITFRALADNQTEITVTEYGYTSDQMLEMSKAGLEQCLDKMTASFVEA